MRPPFFLRNYCLLAHYTIALRVVMLWNISPMLFAARYDISPHLILTQKPNRVIAALINRH